MTEKFESGVLTVGLEGRIDSTNAGAIGEQIDGILAKYTDFTLVLDMDDVEYLSSAGIRVVLKLRKKYADMKLINVNSAVYEVFEMTGMTEMMSITKGFRKVSIDGCEIIGRGANGAVYRYDPETIVKVFHKPDSLEDNKLSRELSRKAFVLGIPTIIPYDVVRVGDKFGSMYELLNATSLSKLIAAEPDNLDKYVGMYVDIAKKFHETEVEPGDVPDMKEVAIDWAEFLRDYLPADKVDKLCNLVKNVPDRYTLLHGDYHTNNVMVRDGEALVIDMDTLCYGHPIFEFASMYMGLRAFGEWDHAVTEKFLRMSYELAGKVWSKALELYFDGECDKAAEVEKKAMLIAYTRLMRRTIRRDGFASEDGRQLIENCKKHIEELLTEIDTLDF